MGFDCLAGKMPRNPILDSGRAGGKGGEQRLEQFGMDSQSLHPPLICPAPKIQAKNPHEDQLCGGYQLWGITENCFMCLHLKGQGQEGGVILNRAVVLHA